MAAKVTMTANANVSEKRRLVVQVWKHTKQKTHGKRLLFSSKREHPARGRRKKHQSQIVALSFFFLKSYLFFLKETQSDRRKIGKHM